jgi:hypothetical protein
MKAFKTILAAFLFTAFTKLTLAAGFTITTPFAGFAKGSSPTLPEYIRGIYVYALSAGGVLAIGAIIFWGVVYTLSASMITRKQDAIDGIKQALFGLLLLLGAYLILYTINPSLVNLTQPYGPPVPPPASQPPQQQTSQSTNIIFDITSEDACTSRGGQVYTPCQQYCAVKAGMCSSNNVCCGLRR